MGRSLLIMGALMGADVRLAGPASLRPPDDVVELRPGDRGAHRRADHDHRGRRRGGRQGRDFLHTDVWVSMGESKDVWDERMRLLAATR